MDSTWDTTRQLHEPPPVWVYSPNIKATFHCPHFNVVSVYVREREKGERERERERERWWIASFIPLNPW
jgi:hypothetical protein